jgi:two-component system invasion response regulator UvrY
VARTPDIFDRPTAGDGAASAPISPRVRTLIVDDSEAVRIGLSQLLQSRPCCELVGAVSEPDAALEVTRTMHPHVVLQDFSMPGHDAIALVRELSACHPRPTVLMLSAFADAPSARKAVEAGAIGWVLKDSDPDQIFGALLRAAGIRDGGRTAAGENGARRGGLQTEVPPPPSAPAAADFEVATPLDARTLRAILRALQSEPGGLTVDEVANRAVIPAALAARYLQRLGARHRALVAARGSAVRRTYGMTEAGRLELARLERRTPEARVHAAPPL